MSGKDERIKQEIILEGCDSVPICPDCASYRYKRDWRDLGTATLDLDDGELLVAYHPAEDFEWIGGWRCGECGREANEENQHILGRLFRDSRGDD